MYATQFHDSRLTHQGISEALVLRGAIKKENFPVPELVAVSPLSRTLETAKHVFGDNAPCVVVEQLRERSGRFPCEQRRKLRLLKKYL